MGAEKVSSTTRGLVGEESGRVERYVMVPQGVTVGRRATKAAWQAALMWGVLAPSPFGGMWRLVASCWTDLAKRVAIRMANPLVFVEGGGFSMSAGSSVPSIFNRFLVFFFFFFLACSQTAFDGLLD